MSNYRDIEVPESAVQDLRTYFGDQPEWNRLVEGHEISDEKIKLAFRLYVHHFNNRPPQLDKQYDVEDFPSALVMFKGVVIELLTMAGLIESRNFLNFSDANANFQIQDKARDYQQWITKLMQTHRQDAQDIKVAKNCEEGFDFISSPDGPRHWVH